MRPGILHRLDKDTSGLLIVAKNDFAHRTLAEELKHRRIRRRYLTAAWGRLPEEETTVDAPLGRHPTDRKRMAVAEGGRRAVTRFKRKESWRAADLLRRSSRPGGRTRSACTCCTSATPSWGTRRTAPGVKRGSRGRRAPGRRSWRSRTPRQFLHAAELRFQHPRSGEEMRFRAPLPPDLQAVAEWARGARTAGRRSEEPDLEELKEKIQRERGFNAHFYKDKCLRRRLAVRMRARGEETFSGIPGSWTAIPRSTTSFWTPSPSTSPSSSATGRRGRDRPRGLPHLFDLPPVRKIWSAGCASGEEVYTVAILLREWAEAHGRTDELADSTWSAPTSTGGASIPPRGRSTRISPSRRPRTRCGRDGSRPVRRTGWTAT